MNRQPFGSFFRVCGLLLLLVGPMVLGAPPAWPSSLEDEIARKNKELAAQKKEIQALTEQERKLNKDLAKLERSVKDAADQLADLEQDLAQLKKDQADNAKLLSNLLAEREKTAIRLAELMRSLWPIYLTAKEQGFASPEQWAEANRQEEWLTAMYREAQTLREDIERQSQIVADQQAVLDQNTAASAAQMDKIKASRLELDKKKSQFQRQVREIRTKKTQGEKELQNLAGAIASLRHKISLQSTKQISKLQGKLTWPAKGKTVTSFAPDKNPASNGIGLALTSGTAVRSMSWGKVVHNDQLRGFGQVVIIFHGEDYYSLYAFLSETNVSVGSDVERGQQIGVCGFYPAAKGDGLYFELRFRQKAVNPLKWLQSG